MPFKRTQGGGVLKTKGYIRRPPNLVPTANSLRHGSYASAVGLYGNPCSIHYIQQHTKHIPRFYKQKLNNYTDACNKYEMNQYRNISDIILTQKPNNYTVTHLHVYYIT